MIFVGLLFFGVLLFSQKESILSSDPSYDDLFKKYAPLAALDWKVLKAIAMKESSLGLDPLVVAGLASTDGKSYGLMQMTLTTGADFDPSVTKEKLNNPDYSVWISAKYLNFVQKYFSKDDPRFLEWVVKSYNQGQGNTLSEIAKKHSGYANGYWIGFQKNYSSLA